MMSDDTIRIRNPLEMHSGSSDEDEDDAPPSSVVAGRAVGPTRASSGTGYVSASAAIASFKSLDEDNSGGLGRDEVGKLLERIGKPASRDAVNTTMRKMLSYDPSSSMGQDSDEVSVSAFVAWFDNASAAERSAVEKASGLGAVVDVLGHQLGSLGTRVQLKTKKKLGMKIPAQPKSRGVPPESIFVIDRTGVDVARQENTVRERIYQKYDAEFHHLADLLSTRENEGHWQSVWDEFAKQTFDSDHYSRALEWSADTMAAALTTIEASSNGISAESGFRAFLREQEMEKQDTGEHNVQRISTVDVTNRAHRFARNAQHHQFLLDEELVPLEGVILAVTRALEKERKARQEKIAELQRRRESIGVDTPRKIQVVGLRGDASEANGTYCADGLRCFWGRPLYVQLPEHQELAELNYLYFDMVYRQHPDKQRWEWIDGSWQLGPTLNSGAQPMPTSRAKPCTTNRPKCSARHRHRRGKCSMSCGKNGNQHRRTTPLTFPWQPPRTVRRWLRTSTKLFQISKCALITWKRSSLEAMITRGTMRFRSCSASEWRDTPENLAS